jgi:hypothetical protein
VLWETRIDPGASQPGTFNAMKRVLSIRLGPSPPLLLPPSARLLGPSHRRSAYELSPAQRLALRRAWSVTLATASRAAVRVRLRACEGAAATW